jgi:hypothetical protein
VSTIYNLEYRILDKLNRTKDVKHGGIFSNLEKLEAAKQNITESTKGKKVAFDVYIIEKNIFGVY